MSTDKDAFCAADRFSSRDNRKQIQGREKALAGFRFFPADLTEKFGFSLHIGDSSIRNKILWGGKQLNHTLGIFTKGCFHLKKVGISQFLAKSKQSQLGRGSFLAQISQCNVGDVFRRFQQNVGNTLLLTSHFGIKVVNFLNNVHRFPVLFKINLF